MARLYEACLDDLSTALPAAEWEARVAVEAPAPRLRELFSSGWTFGAQGEGALGDRLERAFSEAFREGCAFVVAAGSDAPTLRALDVRGAFAALEEGADVVFAPSPDGGYALVGARCEVSPRTLFEGVRWSTPHALGDTRRSAEAAGARVALLPPVPDVDVAEDLDTLWATLEAHPEMAPKTREVLFLLRGRGLWPGKRLNTRDGGEPPGHTPRGTGSAGPTPGLSPSERSLAGPAGKRAVKERARR